ncbi:hypothetical protein [Aliiroseovarius sp. xm-v-208]|uniref:hypothetical protein n=1 Tax=Aliiroseovarius sp. xm-v-208 TaxID=2651835 RepID=UPI00156A0FE8|nr:hypothetical protein [Aliiroseovarius sp. xm-v-208]NRQ12719.1 hypothetical protein [Aliiroseovarius sp. xm-v-208]
MTKTAAKTTAAEMNAFEMLSSILVGLYKTEAKARAEYDALIADNPTNPFAPGVGPANDLLNITAKAKRDLEYELRRMARSSGLSLPDTSSVKATADE